MATYSSILAWRIPWTEKPGGLQSTGSQTVRHHWAIEHPHTDTQFKEYISNWLHHQVATSEIKVRMLCGTSGKAALQVADLVGEGPFCLPAFLPFTFLKNETALRMEGWQSREKEPAQLWNPTLDRLCFDFYFFFFFWWESKSFMSLSHYYLGVSFIYSQFKQLYNILRLIY